MKVALILPFYNEQEVIPEFIKVLIESLRQTRDEFNLVVIDDGSIDKSLFKLKSELPNDEQIKSHLLVLHQNYGHEKALRAGLEYIVNEIEYDCVAVMDTDLQDPPSALVSMLDIYRLQQLPIFGRSIERQDGLLKKLLAKLYYKIQENIINSKNFSQVRNFFVISPKVAQALDSGASHFQSTRINLFELTGKNSLFFEFQRGSRHAGSTHYSVLDSLQLAIDGLLSQPKKFLGLLGKIIFVSLFFSISLGIYIVYFKLFNGSKTTPGLPLVLLTNSLFFTFTCIFFYFTLSLITRVYSFSRNLPSYIVSRIER